MGTSILNIGVTGLHAAQTGLLTTGHNIANAATPGFNRQQIVQTTNTPQFTGAGFFGQGTDVQTVRRIYSDFLAQQVSAANTRVSQSQSYSNEIAQLDHLLADADAGLSPALQDFFGAVNGLAADPASLPARQAMLSSAQSLAARFQSLDARLTEINAGVNDQIKATVSEIGAMAGQIADLNQRILLAQAASGDQAPNDLFDQRDQLLADLNTKIRVSTTANDDGTLNVFIGNGQTLVVRTQVSLLHAVASVEDVERMEVAMATPGGGLVRMPEALLAGGSLGGLLAFRTEALEPAVNALGRVAIGFASTFNAQHALGQDLAGALGRDMFRVGSPQVRAATANAGNASIGAVIADVGQLTASDYRLAYDGAAYTLTRLSDNRAWSAATVAGLPPSGEGQGFALSLASGTPQAGDTFLIRPTALGARQIATLIADGRNIAAASPIRGGALANNTGTGAIATTYAGPAAPPSGRITISVAGGQLSATDAGGNVVLAPTAFSAGTEYTIGSVRFALSGVPQNGDRFYIEPNTAGTGDNRNALLLGRLQTANTLAGGTTSFQGAYGQMVSAVGNLARSAQVTLKAQESLAKQALDAQQALSGVNLDEEAANLLRYQQLFQASSKMIEIAGRLFDELLSLGR